MTTGPEVRSLAVRPPLLELSGVPGLRPQFSGMMARVTRRGSQERSKAMRKLILLLAMLAMVVVVTSVTAPAMAQDPKAERKAERKAARQAAKAEKAGAKNQMKEQLPKSGGIPVNAALLGLGACAMLVGGGLLVRRVTR